MINYDYPKKNHDKLCKNCYLQAAIIGATCIMTVVCFGAIIFATSVFWLYLEGGQSLMSFYREAPPIHCSTYHINISDTQPLDKY